jgi:hypothetical protein
MPNPDSLLHTIDCAADGFRATPGRRGRLVELQELDEVLAAGDMHGNVANFKRLLDRAELAKHPRRHLVLQELIHGPFHYPNGGDKSHQLLDLLSALKCQYPDRVHMLLGNHELAQWTGQWIAKGEHDLNDLFFRGVKYAYGARAAEVYDAYRRMLAGVPLAVRTPNRVFLCHSLPSGTRLATFDPAVLEREELTDEEVRPGGAIHALVWGRDRSAENAAAFLQKVDADLLITGHIPCEQGFEVPNERQLIVDSLRSPACYCLFPVSRPLTHKELVECVGTL